MANEFVAKNGLIAQNNSVVSGSLIVTNGITGSLFGTSSQAVSASYTATSSYGFNAVSASYAYTASSAISSSYALTASYLLGYISPFPFTGSAQITGSLGVTGSFSVRANSGSSVFSSNADTLLVSGSFIITGSASITGSLTLSGSTTLVGRVTATDTTGSLFGTASWARNAVTASYALGGDASAILYQTASAAFTWSFNHFLQTQYPVFTIYDNTNSVIVPQRIQAVDTSSALIYFSSPTTGIAVASKGGYSSSVVTSATIANTAITASFALSGTGTFSGSFSGSYQGNFSGSLIGTASQAVSASYAYTASSASTAFSASYAQTSSFANNFTVANTLTAQTLVVSTISSSITYSSGSNIFGNNLSNTQVLTGSVGITGSLTLRGDQLISGSLILTTASTYTPSYDLEIPQSAKFGGIAQIYGNGTIWSFQNAATINRQGTGNQSMLSMLMGGTSSTTKQIPLRITGSWNQSGTAGYTVLEVAAIETTTGSGAKLLQDWVTNGVSRASLDSAGRFTLTGSINASQGFTGSLFGTASQATSASYAYTASSAISASYAFTASSAINASASLIAVSSSYAFTASSAIVASASLIATSASYAFTASSAINSFSSSNALTASFVNTLNQNVVITGSLTIGTGSGNSVGENTLTIGPAGSGGSGEGGQLLLMAKSDGFTSASMLDTYQNRFRLLRGTNTGSTAEVFSANLNTNQIAFTSYTSAGAFPGTVVANLAVDSGGNILTVAAGTVTSASYAFTASSAISSSYAYTASSATTASTIIATVTGTNSTELVRGNMADNDQFRILVGGTATNAGYVEIATADDATEPIYVRQYTGVFSSLTRTATLLDGAGNTSFPGTVSATFIGNLTGTASFATSYLGSGSISTRLTNEETASALLIAASGSFSTRVTNTETTASNLVAASGSFSTRVTQIERTYATTGSNIYTGSQNILGAITASAALINGTLTAQTLVVTTVSSSVVFSSGSNIFGNSTANTQTMTGSLNVSGSATIIGRVTATDLTGSLFGTASWATNFITGSVTSASFAFTASSAISASFASTASSVNTLVQPVLISGSFTVVTGSGIEFQVTNTGTKLGNLITDSHNITGSLAVLGSITGSLSGSLTGSLFGTASQALTASFALRGNGSFTGSFSGSVTASLFGTASQAISSSYALTASYALNAGGGGFPYSGSAQITGSLGVTGSFSVTANQGSSVFSSNADTLLITGSLVITGSGAITGSLSVSNGITGSLFGTASQAVTASYALTASYVASIAGLSTSQIATGSVTASVGQSSASFQLVSGSTTFLYVSNSGNIGFGTARPSASLDVSGSVRITNGLNVTGSTNITGSLNVTNGITGSLFGTSSWSQNALTASYALGGSANSILYQTASAATTWSFNHFLQTQYPVFTIYDEGNNVIIPQKITAVDTSSALIYFSSAKTGVAVASKGGYSASVVTSATTANTAITASYALLALSASNAPGFTFTFSQSLAAVTWSISHNMNTRTPLVQVYDLGYNQLIPNQIVSVTQNLTEVRFDYGQTGYAVLSSGMAPYVTGSTSFLNQTTPAVTWSFAHNLNTKYVNFQVYDSTDYTILPSAIKVIDTNNAEIHLAYPMTGVAVANFSGINGQMNAATASFVNPLRQNVIISGSLVVTGSTLITGSLSVSGSMTAISGSFSVSGSEIINGFTTLTRVSQSLNYADDVAAAAGGVPLGGLYRNGNFILIRLS